MQTINIYNIGNFIATKLGKDINVILPRPAVAFAKKWFKDDYIDAIEVGTFKGYHARCMLNNLNIRKIWLIDPYVSYPNYANDPSSNNLPQAREHARNILIAHKDKINWIPKLSSEALAYLPNKVDFVYIDANHNYEYVKEDLQNYFLMLKSGGIIAGHDIEYPPVRKAVLEFYYTNLKYLYKLNISPPDFYIIKR